MNRRGFLTRGAGVAAALATAGGLARCAIPRPSGSAAVTGPRPPHHDPDGGFLNPWPTAERQEGGFLRWQRERRENGLPPLPPPGALPIVPHRIAHPRAAPDELRITWVGHATYLIQIGGMNVLTDPHWSRRASPVQWMGPARFVAPGVPWEQLPPIDAVLLSHDHYDHLDHGTVRRLQRRFGEGVHWFAPLGYRGWFRSRGVRRVTEMDWWQEAEMPGPAGALRVTCLPAQHWTSRTPWDRQQKLWASWAIGTAAGRRVYFGGDSGWFPGYGEIGGRAGPFDAVLMPVGAYDPRWFMKPVHMNPEEAVRAY
ncbi:MAG: MBL fold metallo-hydrolase, partial [Gemmatimonadota bacterium]|nr:MBL fold metallo-hydrolase [Gemmatimonadota bacterium]